MIKIKKVDTTNKNQVKRFIQVPFRLYEGNPYWVPPIIMDVEMALNREKHPFFENADVDFYLAVQEGRDVGRIAAVENKSFNKYHDTKQAQFFFFDCEEDQAIAEALFNQVTEWAKDRGLNQVVGPKGFGPLDGYGMMQKGFEHLQTMNMASYNFPYYPEFVEALGYRKEVDFITTYIHTASFQLPERVHRIADRVKKRGSLRVHTFQTKRELTEWAPRIGKAYNDAFVNNWEYYPLTDREIQFVLDNILQVANPKLIKVILHQDDVVGFALGFPDVSKAMQKAKGKLFPFGIIHLLLNLRNTNTIALNGMGILDEYQGRGGNALMYSEMYKTIKTPEFEFEHGKLVQVAETAVQMRRDLVNLGAEELQNHRVYIKDI